MPGALHAFWGNLSPRRRVAGDLPRRARTPRGSRRPRLSADEDGEGTRMHVAGDATTRTPGQHARASVLRLRLRTLVTLGVLAVATAALGRIFGLHDLRFLFAELALLASMFVISRYVLPLVDRRD